MLIDLPHTQKWMTTSTMNPRESIPQRTTPSVPTKDGFWRRSGLEVWTSENGSRRSTVWVHLVLFFTEPFEKVFRRSSSDKEIYRFLFFFRLHLLPHPSFPFLPYFLLIPPLPSLLWTLMFFLLKSFGLRLECRQDSTSTQSSEGFLYRYSIFLKIRYAKYIL